MIPDTSSNIGGITLLLVVPAITNSEPISGPPSSSCLTSSSEAVMPGKSSPSLLFLGFTSTESASLRAFRVVGLHLSPEPQTQTPVQSAH